MKPTRLYFYLALLIYNAFFIACRAHKRSFGFHENKKSKSSIHKYNKIEDTFNDKNKKNLPTKGIRSTEIKEKQKKIYQNFEYTFEKDGDIELTESKKKELLTPQKGKPTNKYLQETDSLKFKNDQKEAPNSIKKNILYSSMNNISMDLDKNEVNFLGEGVITQEDMLLKAARMKINLDTKLLKAYGKSRNGILYSPPIINYKKNYYLATQALYNTETDKAFALNIISPQQIGIFRAKKFKKNDEKYYYVEDATFTTCRLEDAHFNVNATKAKIIKDDRVITGPFNLTLGGIKTPLGFLYSVFRITDKRESGFLFPDMGFNSVKGFYIDNYGYFFVINDYMGLSVKGGYNSEEGNITQEIPFDYAKEDSFQGSMAFKMQFGLLRDTYTYLWDHSTSPKPWGYLNAKVNIKYEKIDDPKNFKTKYRENEEDLRTDSDVNFVFNEIFYLPYDLNLNFSYTKKFGRKLRDTSKTEENKSLEEKESELDNTHIVIPKINLRSKTFYIFKFIKSPLLPQFISNLNVSHQLEALYDRNRIRDFGKFFDKLIKKPKETLQEGRIDPISLNDPITHYGIKNTIPIATNTKIFKHFILDTNFTWIDRWYFDKFKFEYDDEQKKVIAKEIEKNGFFRVGEYSFASNIKTTLELRKFFSKESYFQAIRHKVIPSIGFSFSPGYGKNSDGYFQKVYNRYTKKIEKKYKFDDLYGNPNTDAKAILSFKIQNNIELKIKDSNQNIKNIKLLKSLDFSTGYDLIAEKYKLQDFHISASTALWDDKINIKTDFVFDPYMYGKINDQWEKLDDYSWNHGKFIGELRNAKLNVELSFKEDKSKSNEKEEEVQFQNYRRYVEFKIPWNLRLSYNIEYHSESPLQSSERKLEEERIKNYIDKNQIIKQKTKIVAHNIHLDGDLDLTKKWKLGVSVLYNIKEERFESPRINITRDLHCWILTFNWTPLNYFNSIDFSLRVKANILKSIKYRTRGKM